MIVGATTGSAFVFNIANEKDISGTITFNWQKNTETLVKLLSNNGYTVTSYNTGDRGQPRHLGWWDAETGDKWDAGDVGYVMNPIGNNRLTVLNTHANHVYNTTPTTTLFTAWYLQGSPFPGAVLVNLGCHSGYSTGYDATAVPGTWNWYTQALVLTALERQIAYHASTTYGHTTKDAELRYNDNTHWIFLHYLLNGARTTGLAHAQAQLLYYNYYNVGSFRERDIIGLYGTELYGLPTQRIVRALTAVQVAAIADAALTEPQRLEAATTQVVTASLQTPNFRVTTDGAGYTLFEVPHGGRLTAQGDGPYVPLLVRSFYFPAGTTGLTVTLAATETTPHAGVVQLAPQWAGDRTFGASPIPFSGTAPYPDKLFWTTIHSDTTGVRLAISAVPLRYDPVTGQVTLYDRMDFQVHYDAPATTTLATHTQGAVQAASVQIGNLTVNNGAPVSIGQSSLPMSMTVTTGQAQPLTLRWGVEDGSGLAIRSGVAVFTATAGTSSVAWASDSLGWLPGPKVLHVRLEDASGVTVATAEKEFTAQGRSLTITTSKGIYGPADASASLRA